MEKPNVTQIILGVWVLALALFLIPFVWIWGDSINGTYLGTQLVIGSLGFVILTLEICQIVVVT